MMRKVLMVQTTYMTNVVAVLVVRLTMATF